MALLSGGQSEFFGLDIGSTAIRAVQLHGSGNVKTLSKHGQQEIEAKRLASDSTLDKQHVVQMIRELMGQGGFTSQNVAINLPSSKVFTAIIDMDNLPKDELAKTMQFQAESFIPTPIAKSKMDWAVIGTSPKDAKKVEVLITSAPSDFIEDRVAMVESAGLNVVAVEPDSMAIARALVASDTVTPQLVMDIGNVSTDLVIVMNGIPHLTRAIPSGVTAITRAVMNNLGVDVEQASQFVSKFGLGKDKLEGKIYASIQNTIEALMTDVEKSINFFNERYSGTKIDRMTVTGAAASIPELPVYMANRFGLNVEIGNSWRNVNVPSSQQNELAAISNHFAVAVGLAERN